MRKVTAGLFISIDGVVEAPNLWQVAFDEEMGAAITASINAQDAILLGRTTYEEWAGYWPTATDEPFASHMNLKTKYVVSRTLTKTDWKNSVLLKGSLANEVPKLKRMPGKDIGVGGSPSVVRALLDLDLLDELQLIMSPVIAGKGKKLFTGGEPLKKMTLVDLVKSRTGTAILTYHPAR